jgi:hypothetical protein
MSKKLNKRNAGHEGEWVALDDVYMPERTIERIRRKDHGQIEQMRCDFVDGRTVVRVVLRPRPGGGYNVEDGRHRVIAAKLAGERFLEALIVGK